ncbi:SRPBCC domain-containing protein [Arthrobacter mobilis]|uniref:Activator of Hsp90 ATPase homologue 1/2-like C-terminal domain-containing protein n=1 Tax=Arthrobacter mobilis TaxID=2724944 RepID=A0A7X6QMQ9_9MICC|nr:SRPBCC domain-containing protein [Arthrobacter mobilis]NKX56868.1 hypothetical protein [Arthrobacter mobilis]
MSSSLFSHAPDLPEQPAPLPDLQCEVAVPHAPAQAFEGFTDLIHLWWPVESRSVYGEGSHLEFEDRVLAETSPADEVSIWGEVLDWQPADSLRLTWHPGTSAASASEVRIAFVASGEDRTLVRLVHSGWEKDPDGAARRGDYEAGWPGILARYARFMGGPA